MAKRTKWKLEFAALLANKRLVGRNRTFIESLAQTGNVSAASRAAGGTYIDGVQSGCPATGRLSPDAPRHS